MIDKKMLAKELNDCWDGEIFLIETAAPKVLEVHLAAMKLIAGKNCAQIIVSASRPCKNLLGLYEENDIDTGKMTIVCTCCQKKAADSDALGKGKIIHVPTCSALTDISLSLSRCMESVKGKKFIVIDSINTMLIHNEPNTLAKFIHSILTKMRTNNVSGLLISLKAETNREVRAEIAQLCDKIITL